MPNTEITDVGENNTENRSVAPSQVSHVAVKIPPLWKSKIKLWFIQVESNFALAKITNDDTKYNHLISCIDAETLSTVSDILFSPPTADKYNALKSRLIAEFSASENEQIRQLISELHLGDDRPSQLLRKMRELGGKSVNDDFLKTLWFQRLPSEMQSILAISSESLDNLAKMADKISEVRTPTNTDVYSIRQATAGSAQRVSSLDEINVLRSEIASLTSAVERLSRERTRDSRSPYRNKSPHPRRSSSRPRHNTEYCFYHNRFGDRAKNCRAPCTFNQREGSEN